MFLVVTLGLRRWGFLGSARVPGSTWSDKYGSIQFLAEWDRKETNQRVREEGISRSHQSMGSRMGKTVPGIF